MLTDATKAAVLSPLLLLGACRDTPARSQGADTATAAAPAATAGLTPMQPDSDSPYYNVGYAPLMFTGFGVKGPMPPQFQPCHRSSVDTLVFELLTFEVSGDSIRGLLQDSIEGNPEAPVAAVSMAYDSVARLLTFDIATASRTLLSFALAPSCDSLVGVELYRTAYHPTDGRSGIAARNVTFRRVR